MEEKLDKYVSSNLPKVRVIHLEPPRKGLMFARVTGAKQASGEVLIFLDTNVEANINWLPPLLGISFSTIRLTIFARKK